jgi:hypothetical protein
MTIHVAVAVCEAVVAVGLEAAAEAEAATNWQAAHQRVSTGDSIERSPTKQF